MNDVEKSYPFLRDDFQEMRNDLKTEMERDKTFLQDMGGDPGPHIQIAESRGKTNLLFLEITGHYYCSAQDCTLSAYADEGTGYKKVSFPDSDTALVKGSVYVTRTGGQMFFYLTDPTVIITSPAYDALTGEFILKDHQFVENKPPPPPSPSPSPPPSSASVPSIPVRWYEGMDAPGSDFGPWLFSVANAEDCIGLCAQDSGCVGVTYNIRRSVCIRKSRIRSLNYTRDAATTGVLTDRTPAPEHIASPAPYVHHYENVDAPGNNRGNWIRGVSSADCESICIADSGCAGYTYNRLRATCIPRVSSSGSRARASRP